MISRANQPPAVTDTSSSAARLRRGYDRRPRIPVSLRRTSHQKEAPNSRAATVSRLFGHGDEVTANGVARTVVRYMRDRSYRRREHEYDTMCDLYACEISPAKESPFIISVNYEFR